MGFSFVYLVLFRYFILPHLIVSRADKYMGGNYSRCVTSLCLTGIRSGRGSLTSHKPP